MDGIQAGASGQDPEHMLKDLVERFSASLLDKMRASERKYGWENAWLRPGWMDECRYELLRHVEKGDPLDVAAFCAFLWHHGERTTLWQTTKPPRINRDAIVAQLDALPDVGTTDLHDCTLMTERAAEALAGAGGTIRALLAELDMRQAEQCLLETVADAALLDSDPDARVVMALDALDRFRREQPPVSSNNVP